MNEKFTSMKIKLDLVYHDASNSILGLLGTKQVASMHVERRTVVYACNSDGHHYLTPEDREQFHRLALEAADELIDSRLNSLARALYNEYISAPTRHTWRRVARRAALELKAEL